jgi:Domain of unknown function (DUF4214)
MYSKQLLSLFLTASIVCLQFTLTQAAISDRLQPTDLEYLGAFRLPDSPATPDNVNWEWSNWAAAATYFPNGDPDGPSDGYLGSLFGVGHDQTQYISEISIPVPVKSVGKNVAELNTAGVLQDFKDIKGSLYGHIEMPRVGLEYLPAHGDQITDKLYFSWADHLDEGNTGSTHGWCELNLTTPQSQGIWAIGGRTNYVTGDYIFEIPSAWAAAYTPGYRLATGRYRDGGQDAQGPALFTFGPWNQGNPPAGGAVLLTTTLLMYDNVLTPEPQHNLNNYSHADEWNGGAWLTAGNKSAIIFVGNKGVGNTWYGCDEGQVCPPECECGESRGWWANTIEAQMIFYDPDDIAKVVQGTMAANLPQPYAVLSLDSYLYHLTSAREKYHISAVAYDRLHGLLFIFEPSADGDKAIVHVWKLSDQSDLLTQTQVSQLYVSIFGRASEGEGNSYWQSNQTDMTIAANTMLDTGPAKAYFGSTLNENQAFIEFIYLNTLGKTYTEDPTGINYWVNQLSAGKSKGEVIATMISAATDPQYAGSAAQNQFNNKVIVCSYTAGKITTVPDVNNLFAFVNFIKDVTHYSSTVTAAKAAVDAF